MGNIARNGFGHQRFYALLVGYAVTNISRALRHGGHVQPLQGKFLGLDGVDGGVGADRCRARSYLNYSESGQVAGTVPMLQGLRLVLADEQTQLRAGLFVLQRL